MKDQKPEISIVIPVFNEAASLSELTVRCLKACNRMKRIFEIILVDDGSGDGSRDMIEAAADQYPGVIIGVLLNRNYGQHSAIMAGFAQAKGDIVGYSGRGSSEPARRNYQTGSKSGRGI
jgi:undecaprenyl-phosphate 4-deoxy-4-formamido-L-arabinose transferase